MVPAKTHGLAVGLGGMFFGRTARRWLKSRTAMPVNSMVALSGSAATLIVARAGVLPNSKCLSIRMIHCFIAHGIKHERIHEHHVAIVEPSAFNTSSHSVERSFGSGFARPVPRQSER